MERTSQKHSVPKQLASIDKDFTNYPFMKVSMPTHNRKFYQSK